MAPAYGYKFEAVNAYSKNTGWAVLLAEFIVIQLEKRNK